MAASSTGVGISRRWAVLPLVIAALLNEWTLGPIFATDGTIDGVKLWLVRGFDVLALIVTVIILIGGLSLVKLYRDVALIGFNLLLLILVINLLAFTQISHWALDYFYNAIEFARAFPEKVSRIHSGDPVEKVVAKIYSPGAVGHPSLPLMMRPSESDHYRSGANGERISCGAGKPVDTPLDGAVWMFGGSTTYGTGVSDCETIASALNSQDPAHLFVNLGVESYTRNAEVARLILLLRQGYRPKAVIFLDGLNDIDIATLRAPLLPAHSVQPTLAHSYYHQVLNDDLTFWSNLAGRMPLLRVLKTPALGRVEDILECADEPAKAGLQELNAPFFSAPLTHLGRQTASARAIRSVPADQLPASVLSSCGRRIVNFYKDDQRFLEGLGRAFGFPVVVFLQPLGMLSPVNPYIRDPEKFATLGYPAFIAHMVGAVREEIANGGLPSFVDLSQVGLECEDCFVDPNHYSPALNAELAELMLEAMQRRGIFD